MEVSQMEKLVLTRKGNDVFYDGRKLTRVDQATKGPNNEVVKIEGLPNSNGKKWISLSLLAQGINEITCTAKVVTRHAQTSIQKPLYTLTPEETITVKDLQSQIDVIVEAAKARYIPKPNLDIDPTQMTPEEREAKIAEIMKYYNLASSADKK